MFGFFKSVNTQKILVVILVLFLLVVIPVTIWFGVQQQTNTQNHAAFLNPNQKTYPCGSSLSVIVIPVSENKCSDNAYQSVVQVKAAPGSKGAYQVHWKWSSYWCTDAGTGNPTPKCKDTTYYQETNSTSSTQGLTGNNAAFVTASSPVGQSKGPYAGQVCGHFQNDFAFYVTPNDSPSTILCGISGDAFKNPGLINQTNATSCSTNVACTQTSPTPTNTPTPSATDTPTITDTPTPTVITDTPTPTEITPTDTPGGPTSTPVPPTVTVKPPLPPTGPGNTVIGIGLIGAAAAVIGTIVILAL